MKFRKKPIVIEAEQLTDENKERLAKWCKGKASTGYHPMITIPTLEGEMVAHRYDYIIKGVKGEFYPVKQDIFEMIYEKAQGYTPGEKQVVYMNLSKIQTELEVEVAKLILKDDCFPLLVSLLQKEREAGKREGIEEIEKELVLDAFPDHHSIAVSRLKEVFLKSQSVEKSNSDDFEFVGGEKQADPNCECDCHKVIDRDRFGGSHKCC